MLNYAVRLAKRFAVLIPGLVIAYFSVHNIFPFIDKGVPAGLAIFITYVLAAYVLIPLLIRAVRIIFPARHLQSYCVTPDGFASDPINIGIIGTKKDLVTAMKAAGWHVADKHTIKNLAHEMVSAFFNRSYDAAPMSNLYLFGRKQDIGFEMDIAGSRGHRHHVRFWATTYRPGAKLNFGTILWHRQRKWAISRHTLWVGAASKDVGFALIRHNVQVTHMIDPDTDSERQLIIDGLSAQDRVVSTKSVRVNKPYKLVNRAWRGQLLSDGYMKVIKLKK